MAILATAGIEPTVQGSSLRDLGANTGVLSAPSGLEAALERLRASVMKAGAAG